MANQKNGKNRGETPARRDGFYFDDDLDSVTAGLPTGDEPEEDEVPDLPPEEDNAPPTEGYNRPRQGTVNGYPHDWAEQRPQRAG